MIAAVMIGSLVAMLTAVAVAVGLFANDVVGKMHTIGDPFAEVSNCPTHQAPTVDGSSTSNQPINFLVMGSDSRISAGDTAEWEAGAQRTDALMLVHVSGDREHIAIMSIPRDSWVDIPGYGKAKINAAFSFGGPALTIQTVEQLTGVPIDHIALVDFTTFVGLTDIVGGVTLETVSGTQTMDGKQALDFVRERYSLPGGDFDRVRRQQLWMKAVLSKLLTKEVLTSPSTMMDIATTLSEDISVDSGLGVTDIVSMGSSMVGFDQSNLIMFTAPVAGTGTSDDGQSIVNLDMDKLERVSKAFQQDAVAEFIEVNGKDLETLESRPVN